MRRKQQGLKGIYVEQAFDSAHHSVESRNYSEYDYAPYHKLELDIAENYYAYGYRRYEQIQSPAYRSDEIHYIGQIGIEPQFGRADKSSRADGRPGRSNCHEPADGSIKLDALISNIFPFEKYAQAYKFIDESRGKSMKVIIDLDASDSNWC